MAGMRGLMVFLLLGGGEAPEVSFNREVMAVLSKAGCNQGVCHGNRYGKGGFKLSLRGQDPDLDFLALSRDVFARRANRLEPEKSLILLKPTGQVPHQGGVRFPVRSPEYEILRRWIGGGLRADPAGVPGLERLEVTPREATVIEPADSVEVRARALFSDGTSRDVTRIAVFEPLDPLAAADPDGRVVLGGPGETVVLVRYLHCQEPVRLARVPARPGFAFRAPPAANFIDELIFAKLRSLKIEPSPVAGDSVFLRRAHLDLLGMIPTAEEARAFVSDSRHDKRARLVDELLERPEFAEFWALKWSDLLRNEERALDFKGVQSFYHWIRRSIAEGKPLDRFARELIAGRGSTYQNPAANFYRANRDPFSRAEAAAEVFLGTRLQCARCHNHPFDRWTQDDYYGWTALFARVRYKVLFNLRRDKNDDHEFVGEQVVWMAHEGEVNDPRTGRPAPPRFLGEAGSTPGEKRDRLEDLADWITGPNTLFARTQANRIWYHLMGRGLVEPVDDFRASNPPSNPALLDALSRELVERRFDLRHLIRLITASQTYRLSSQPNETNRDDLQNFSRALVRRLDAEQLLDSQNRVAGVPSKFNGYPLGVRAAQLAGVEAVRSRDQRPTSADQFLASFGKPPRLLTCECERSGGSTLAQAFQLLSGPVLRQSLSHPRNRLGGLLESGKTTAELVDDLYWTALSRPPGGEERRAGAEYLDEAGDRRSALEDLAWALLNSKEFLLRP
jgi:hypothetical protein